jgi:hypothetical protein
MEHFDTILFPYRQMVFHFPTHTNFEKNHICPNFYFLLLGGPKVVYAASVAWEVSAVFEAQDLMLWVVLNWVVFSLGDISMPFRHHLVNMIHRLLHKPIYG